MSSGEEFSHTVTEESESSDESLDGAYSDRLRFIQQEANSLLERLTHEYHVIINRINARADDETRCATEVIERNRLNAIEALDRDFNQRRSCIDALAQQQIQHTYRMANMKRNRKSTENLLASSNRLFRPPLPFSTSPRKSVTVSQRDLPDTSQVYLPIINAVVEFPRIYIKPYDTPVVSHVSVQPFPDSSSYSVPSI
jgi:hypothetical protein